MKRKPKKHLTFLMEEEYIKEIGRLSKKYGISKSTFVRIGVKMFLNCHYFFVDKPLTEILKDEAKQRSPK